MILTVIYMLQAGVMDIKEKKIYSFPCLVLTLLWSAYLLLMDVRYDSSYLFSVWIMHVMLITFMNLIHVWGAGDSDVLLLMLNVFLASFNLANPALLVISECAGVAASLSLAFFIGLVEMRIRKISFDLHGKMALVPGFSIVITAVLVFDLIRMVGI